MLAQEPLPSGRVELRVNQPRGRLPPGRWSLGCWPRSRFPPGRWSSGSTCPGAASLRGGGAPGRELSPGAASRGEGGGAPGEAFRSRSASRGRPCGGAPGVGKWSSGRRPVAQGPPLRWSPERRCTLRSQIPLWTTVGSHRTKVFGCLGGLWRSPGRKNVRALERVRKLIGNALENRLRFEMRVGNDVFHRFRRRSPGDLRRKRRRE